MRNHNFWQVTNGLFEEIKKKNLFEGMITRTNFRLQFALGFLLHGVLNAQPLAGTAASAENTCVFHNNTSVVVLDFRIQHQPLAGTAASARHQAQAILEQTDMFEFKAGTLNYSAKEPSTHDAIGIFRATRSP